jgi:hypothetical protein
MKTTALVLLVLSVGLAYATGCNSDSGTDCVSLCNASQDADCAVNHGDCSSFCSAAVQVTAEANCSDSFQSYLDCSGSGDVCSTANRCSAEYSDTTTCAENYCTAHSDEPSCKELTAQLL